MRRTILFLALVTVSVAQDKLILSAAPPSKAKQTGCAVQELYIIGLTMHDPIERHRAMLEWLDKSTCSADDYVTIWNALPAWAGTSDSPALRAKIMEKAR